MHTVRHGRMCTPVLTDHRRTTHHRLAAPVAVIGSNLAGDIGLPVCSPVTSNDQVPGLEIARQVFQAWGIGSCPQATTEMEACRVPGPGSPTRRRLFLFQELVAGGATGWALGFGGRTTFCKLFSGTSQVRDCWSEMPGSKIVRPGMEIVLFKFDRKFDPIPPPLPPPPRTSGPRGHGGWFRPSGPATTPR